MTIMYNDAIPAAEHDRSCAIFRSGHEQARDGWPGAFHPVPCDCFREEG